MAQGNITVNFEPIKIDAGTLETAIKDLITAINSGKGIGQGSNNQNTQSNNQSSNVTSKTAGKPLEIIQQEELNTTKQHQQRIEQAQKDTNNQSLRLTSRGQDDYKNILLRSSQKELEEQKNSNRRTEETKTILEMKNANKAEQQKKDDERSYGTYGRVLKGIAIGSVTTMAYQAGGLGKVAGSEAGALNANPSNYMDFMTGLMNKQADARQSLYGTASMGAGALAGAGVGALAGSIIPGFGTAIGGAVGLGVGALGSYFTNKSTEEEKSYNQFALSQEQQAWQLKASGLSGAGDTMIKGSGHLLGLDRQDVAMTKLQEIGMKTSALNADIALTKMQGRRDVMGGMSDVELANYNPQLTKQALRTGEDKSQLNMVVSSIAGLSGTKVTDALDKLNKTQEKYGGEQVKIASNALEIMKSNKTITPDKALEMAGQYQQNQGFLSQTVAQQQMPFSSRLRAKMMMQLLPGSTDEEKRTGILSERHQSAYTSMAKEGKLKDSPYAMIMEQIMGLTATNPFLNANKIKGGVGIDVTAQQGTEDGPIALQGMEKMINDAFQNISTMSVTATTVNINGSLNDMGKGQKPLSTGEQSKGFHDYENPPKTTITDKLKQDMNKLKNSDMVPPIVSRTLSGTYNKPK